MQRRERTRHLIEMGGLLALADMLSGAGGKDLAQIWRRRGQRAFEIESENA